MSDEMLLGFDPVDVPLVEEEHEILFAERFSKTPFELYNEIEALKRGEKRFESERSDLIKDCISWEWIEPMKCRLTLDAIIFTGKVLVRKHARS